MSSLLSGAQSSSQIQQRKPPSQVENFHSEILPRAPVHTCEAQLQSFKTYHEDTTSQAVFAGATISKISSCDFHIFNGPVKIVQEKKRRRIEIDSDEEDN